MNYIFLVYLFLTKYEFALISHVALVDDMQIVRVEVASKIYQVDHKWHI